MGGGQWGGAGDPGSYLSLVEKTCCIRLPQRWEHLRRGLFSQPRSPLHNTAFKSPHLTQTIIILYHFVWVSLRICSHQSKGLQSRTTRSSSPTPPRLPISDRLVRLGVCSWGAVEMSSVARTALRMLGVCVCLSVAQAHIWAWMLAMPYTPPEGGPLRHREREPESLPLSHKADSVGGH